MRDNKLKVIALVALIIAVVGLGIGFAAFSSQLTISSGATVTPNASDWNVEFVSFGCLPIGPIVTQPTIEGTTISGIEVAFTEPNAASCTLAVRNTGKYRAYLTKAEFIEETISCDALEEDDENFPEGYTRADDILVEEACKGISSTLILSSEASISIMGDTLSEDYDIEWTINDIPADEDILDYSLGTEVDVDDTAYFVFTISYTASAARADGPFVVKIPDLKLTYSTTPTVQ